MVLWLAKDNWRKKLKPISYKRVYAEGGAFSHLEVSQGENTISISLADDKLDSTNHSYKWVNIQDTIEKHATAVKRELGYE